MINIVQTARIAWGEARGEGRDGLQAVINVIDNRTRDPRYPDSHAAVATQPWQFSAYNDNDPNRSKLERVSDDDAGFVTAMELAAQAVGGGLPDITGGATHYHSTKIDPPFWAEGAEVTAVIGEHVFYKGVA